MLKGSVDLEEELPEEIKWILEVLFFNPSSGDLDEAIL
jgi:hypothetical protein